MAPVIRPTASVSRTPLRNGRVSGYVPTLPSLRPNPKPAPAQTLDLTQGRVGTSPETWIDPRNVSGVVRCIYGRFLFWPLNSPGESQLHVACIKHDVGKVRQLLLDGADVNAVDYAGWTPLHEACNHGHVACVKELLESRPVVFSNDECKGLSFSRSTSTFSQPKRSV